MYVSPYIAQVLTEARIREAQKESARYRAALELSQPVPQVVGGLTERIGQWLRRDKQSKDVRDVRRAHAV
jgi:hypothetical protein